MEELGYLISSMPSNLNILWGLHTSYFLEQDVFWMLQ